MSNFLLINKKKRVHTYIAGYQFMAWGTFKLTSYYNIWVPVKAVKGQQVSLVDGQPLNQINVKLPTNPRTTYY